MELTRCEGALGAAGRIVGFVVVAVGSVAVSAVPSTPVGAAESKPATLIVPAYQYPLRSPSTLLGIWAELADHRPPGGTGYVIANPSSGPGSGSFFSGSDYSNYLYAIGKVQAEGWTVLGYTPTAYGTLSLSAVEGAVNLWDSKYGAGQIGPGSSRRRLPACSSTPCAAVRSGQDQLEGAARANPRGSVVRLHPSALT